MKTPGFTAGATLSTGGGRYRGARAPSRAGGGAIYPADFGRCVFDCLQRCRPRGSTSCADYCSQSCARLLQG